MTPYKTRCRPATAWKNEMKTINVLRRLRCAGLGIVLGSAALPAVAQDDSYYYAGAAVGQSHAKIDERRITASLLGVGLTTTSLSSDERHLAWKLFGGYQLNRYFALEGGYFRLGNFAFKSSTAPAGTLNGEIKLQGLNFDLVGTLPLTGGLSAFARVGAQYAEATDRFRGSGAVHVLKANPKQRGTDYKYGVGLQYEISRSLLVRAEGERYRIDDAVGNRGDVNMFSLSLVFPIGRAAEVAARADAAPEYVAPAPVNVAPAPPAPAPASAVVVAAPERQRVSFSADALFTFDQSQLRPEGRIALDRFAQELNGTQFEMIIVEGHTDRLGSEAYNQQLSSKRAESVKAYLVSPGSIDATKISALGKGESTPVTKPDDCRGTVRNAKLIACLQPDRRVEVEVTGTR